MHALARDAVHYLLELGLPSTKARASTTTGLPYYLIDAFDLAEIQLDGERLLLAIDHAQQRTPADTEHAIRRLTNATGHQAVYVTDSLTSYDRKRLIERRVPFIVPGYQLYLPSLGVALREHSLPPANRPQASLSPSAQALLIRILRSSTQAVWSASDVSKDLGYTTMTASRAAREIETAGLVAVVKEKRFKLLSLSKPPQQVWTDALPLLRSPVQQTLYVLSQTWHALPKMFREAGESALAAQTMLGEPTRRTCATTKEGWQSCKRYTNVFPHPEPGTIDLQVWSYPPMIEPDSDLVDPLSLYLSLHDEADERVQSALDELMVKAWL